MKGYFNIEKEIIYYKEEKIMDINLRDVGMGLLILGLILLIGFGLYSILIAEINSVIRISLGAIIIGILIAIFSLLKEQIVNKDMEIERKY